MWKTLYVQNPVLLCIYENPKINYSDLSRTFYFLFMFCGDSVVKAEFQLKVEFGTC